jgi:predicted RND superfamily exporter protein
MERRHNFLKFITNYFVFVFFITLLLLLTPLFKLNHIHCVASLNTNLPEMENDKRRNHLAQIQQQTGNVKLHVISTIFMNMEHKSITKKKWHQN